MGVPCSQHLFKGWALLQSPLKGVGLGPKAFQKSKILSNGKKEMVKEAGRGRGGEALKIECHGKLLRRRGWERGECKSYLPEQRKVAKNRGGGAKNSTIKKK